MLRHRSVVRQYIQCVSSLIALSLKSHVGPTPYVERVGDGNEDGDGGCVFGCGGGDGGGVV